MARRVKVEGRQESSEADAEPSGVDRAFDARRLGAHAAIAAALRCSRVRRRHAYARERAGVCVCEPEQVADGEVGLDQALVDLGA
jgi:hypothetical protein